MRTTAAFHASFNDGELPVSTRIQNSCSNWSRTNSLRRDEYRFCQHGNWRNREIAPRLDRVRSASEVLGEKGHDRFKRLSDLWTCQTRDGGPCGGKSGKTSNA
jgi:hypothetical protein